MQNFMSKIRLFFDKTTYLVTKIEIYESGNDMTIIQFENIKLNQPINDELFMLK